MTDLLKIFNELDKQPKGRNIGKGNECMSWKGGETISHDRVLIMTPGHPHTDLRGYVRRAKLVMEKKIGRFLKSEEVVHHKDHDKMNDDPDNLILCRDQSEHLSIYHKDKERDANGRFT